MAITVKHSKVSTIPDDADTSLVRPSDWNADHTLVGLGTMAEQNANNVNITGGSITGVTGVGDVVGPASATDNAVARFDTTTGKLIQNSGVTIDDNSNITANALDDGYLNTAASGTLITLTSASVRRYTITGSGGQTIKLPNATTLPNGTIFQFDNNQSSGAITVNNNSNTLVVSVPSGGFVLVNLLSNATAAGSWDRHDQAPANVSWSTNTFDYAGSITSATWNGTAVAINRGGTGQTTASTAFNALSPLTTAGDTLYGGTSGAGTRLAIGTAGQVLTVNSGATAPQWSTPTTGTVTSVSGTGTVSGISLSGTVTSSGNLTLGGTLDLSSPPAIGATASNTATFSLISSTRINPRVTNITSSSTITPPSDTVDQYSVTALAVPATIAIPSGTAVAGQKLVLRLKDDGTARALTWTTSAGGYRVIGSTLPTTTVASKVVYIGCIYNATESFWDVVAVAQQV